MSSGSDKSELVIGIVGRIGVDVLAVVNEISDVLSEYGYNSEHIRTTEAVKELEPYKGLPETPLNKRFEHLIDACNDIRQKTELPDVMARFAISRIQHVREQMPQDGRGRAFIVNQLKRKEECDLLRSIYGEHYIQVSCYSPEATRLARLSSLIAKDHPRQPKAASWKSSAYQLIQRDESEEDKPHGQRVRDVFPLSDVVIDSSTPERACTHLRRFFRALFGDPRVTPTKEEYGMQLAMTAALRSSDLSRQVGAAVLTERAEIQALGCNEVPKAGGGTYWEGDAHDARDFQRAKDSNEHRKREVLLELSLRMQEAGLIDDKYKDTLTSVLLDRDDDVIRDAHVMDSLEYGRAVHAEMNAITDAARNGRAIRDCILYCNTFPCHNCAKHIVASGIKEVVYLRPFPKSFAEDLFSDSVSIDCKEIGTDKVTFRQFIGIVGPLYELVFTKGRWKDDKGDVRPFREDQAKPRFRAPLPIAAYVGKEADATKNLGEGLERAKLRILRPINQDSEFTPDQIDGTQAPLAPAEGTE